MNKNALLWLIVIGCSLGVSMGMVEENKNSTSLIADHGTKKLSRHKRYMVRVDSILSLPLNLKFFCLIKNFNSISTLKAFPEGSSLSVSSECNKCWKLISSDYSKLGRVLCNIRICGKSTIYLLQLEYQLGCRI